MTAVLLRLRADLRTWWRAWAAIAVLIGVTGAAVLAALAGASRTDSAYQRFLQHSHASDLLIAPANDSQAYFDDLAKLDGVAQMGHVALMQTAPIRANGQPDFDILVRAPVDRVALGVIDRPKVLHGRLPDPTKADEVLIDPASAKRLGVGVGGTIVLASVPGDQDQTDLSNALRQTVRVAGIGVMRDGIVPVSLQDDAPSILLSQAGWAALGPTYEGAEGELVRLRPGASMDTVVQQARALVDRHPEVQSIFVADYRLQAATVESAIRPQAIALAVFALLAALTAFVVVGQIVSRQLTIASPEHGVLRSLGMSRNDLVLLSLGQVAVAATVGALLAVGGAIAVSPLFPIGPARMAEPDPGIEVNVAVLAAGFVVIAGLLLLRCLWPAWRLAQGPARGGAGEPGRLDHRSRLAGAVTGLGAPASATIGLTMAFEPGRGRTAVPVRSALMGTIVGIAAVAVTFTFASNLTELVTTPARYGQVWDVKIDTQFGELPQDQVDAFLHADPKVTAWAYGNHGEVTVAGRDVAAVGLRSGWGPSIFPTLLEGRAPATVDEIVLGTTTLRQLHHRVGDTIDVAIQGEPKPMLIVGRAVFPRLGQGSFTPTNLGEGAAVLPSLLADGQTGGPAGDTANFVVVRLAPGAAHDAAVDQLVTQAAALCTPPDCDVSRVERPNDIVSYARIQTTPVVLSVLLAILCLATIAQLLVTSVRRRRRDLAVLKALGLGRRQLSAAVIWQASSTVLVALLVGLPIGIAAGRWLWSVFASHLGVGTEPITPIVALALAVPLTLVVGNLVAAGPAWMAARLKPAAVLRTE